MSNTPIIRQPLQFEREFGMHQNWWVRDRRIAGMPLTLFLYLLSHSANFEVTPADAKRDLGLTDYSWKTAKNTLRRYGFLIEIRDRWPVGSVAPMTRGGAPLFDRKGNARYVDLSRNLRVRVITQDPKPGVDLGPDGGVIEVDQPYEEWLEAQRELVNVGTDPGAVTAPKNSQDGAATAPRNSQGGEEPQISTAPRNSRGGAPVDEIRTTPIKEEENQGWLVGSISSKNQPTTNAAGAREAAIDAELATLHPELSLTFGQIAREVGGRVDLEQVDVVQAVRDTVLRAAARGNRVDNPAMYVASVIARNPGNWLAGAGRPAPFAPAAPTAASTPAAGCAVGDHWWGSEAWAEIDRSHCVHCGTARRNVDPVFAELEAELVVGGER